MLTRENQEQVEVQLGTTALVANVAEMTRAVSARRSEGSLLINAVRYASQVNIFLRRLILSHLHPAVVAAVVKGGPPLKLTLPRALHRGPTASSCPCLV